MPVSYRAKARRPRVSRSDTPSPSVGRKGGTLSKLSKSVDPVSAKPFTPSVTASDTAYCAPKDSRVRSNPSASVLPMASSAAEKPSACDRERPKDSDRGPVFRVMA
jgi:hypothetical protein